MNSNPDPQPTEPVGIGKRLADVWNSRSRIASLVILLTSGLVLNCCCVIIPLASKTNSLPVQSNVRVDTSSTPISTTVQDHWVPSAPAISAHTEIDHNGDGRVACRNFNASNQATTAYIQLDRSDKAGRSCK